MKGIVIALYARTDRAVRDWADAGYQCYCVDIQHSIRRDRVVDNVHYVWGDGRSWTPPAGKGIAFLSATPPCTHVALSGARDFKTKRLRMLTDSLDMFNAAMFAAEWSGAPYWIENPMGVLATHSRDPDYKFDPWEYAGYLDNPEIENTEKETWLWTGGGFVMPEKRPAPGLHRQDCWREPPSDERGDVRSVTPEGFARAVFLANATQEALADA